METLSGFAILVALETCATLFLWMAWRRMGFTFLLVACCGFAVDTGRQGLGMTMLAAQSLDLLPITIFFFTVYTVLLLHAAALIREREIPRWAYLALAGSFFPAQLLTWVLAANQLGFWLIGALPAIVAAAWTALILFDKRQGRSIGEFALAVFTFGTMALTALFAVQVSFDLPSLRLTYLIGSMFTLFKALGFALVAVERQSRRTEDLAAEHDVTRDALRESEERFQKVMEVSQIGIYEFDLEKGVTYASGEYLKQLGYELGELDLSSLEKTLELVHPDDHEKVFRAIEAITSPPYPDQVVELRMRHRDGAYRWIESHGKLVQDPSGARTRIVGGNLDITERQNQFEAVRRSEQKYRDIFESIQDVYYEIQIDGTIVELSPSISRIGYTREELIGKNVQEFFDDPAMREPLIAALLRTGGMSDYEVTMKRKDGSEFPCAITNRLVRNAAGEPVASIGTMRDVSERKKNDDERRRLEAKMLRAQQLESLGMLAGGIAHDFNNVLASIVGNAELVTSQLPPVHGARPRLKLIVDAAEHASGLCKQLLAYAGKGQAAIQRVDLSELVENMTKILDVSVAKRGQLHLETNGEVPVTGDPTQLRQVVLNLITNASEALDGNRGTIAVRTGSRFVTKDELAECILAEGIGPGHFAFVEVSDTGAGIEPGVIDLIFNPFYSTRFPGRGLGLAAVQGIVHAHGGAIRVESTAGEGSRFTVLLPALIEAASGTGAHGPGPAERSGEERAGDSGLILVADDEDKVRDLVCAMLQRSGFEVIAAADGQEAVDLFRANAGAIDIVIMDLVMPRLDGRQALETIRVTRPDLPAILVSGFNDDAVADLPELDYFLAKPFRQRELIQAVQRARRATAGV